MIGGDIKSLKNPLSPKSILSMISEYDIFMYYMPYRDWSLGRKTKSPFRKDNDPSFVIYRRQDDVLYFIDFGDSSIRGDCFEFVQTMFNVDYHTALTIIDKDFGLGISTKTTSDSPNYKKIVSSYSQPEETEKKYSHIQVVTRKFTNEELEYWNQYHQDISDLRENNIYSVKKLYLNRQLIPLKDTELRFGYFYEGKWKIYKPYGTKETKWIPNNVPITAMDGRNNISDCDTAIITKSKKDYMVLKKIYPYVCAVQNEGWACFSEENVNHLKQNSKRQILSFDSDDPGIKASKIVTEMFGFEYCNVPRYYLQEEIKDWSDLAKKYGMQIIEHYLKQKFIIP